jgi:hypothetical protein
MGSWLSRRSTQTAIAGVVGGALTFLLLNKSGGALTGNLLAAALFAAITMVDLTRFGVPKWLSDLCFWVAVVWLVYWFWSVRPPFDPDPAG